MAPKKITVQGVGGVKLSSEKGYENWLTKNNVMCLLDSDGDQVVFESLVDDGTYTLGPPRIQQQQQAQEQRQPPLYENLAQIINSNTESIYNGWANGLFDNAYVLPATETDLKRAVQKELPVALPVAPNAWAPGADVPLQDVVRAREQANAVVLSSDLEGIRNAIFDLSYVGTTEDATHGPIDALIAKPLWLTS